LADQSVVAILTFLHIVSAMGWLGGAIFFLSTISPGVKTFTPPASLEFLTKVGPRLVRFFVGAATATIIFGLGLLFAAFGTDLSTWPMYIETGFGLGLIAYLVALLVTVPTFNKLDKIAKQMIANPQGGPPPPEFATYLKRSNMASIIVVLILLLALVFMVSSAVYS